MPAEGSVKNFGFVQTYDRKPKRRLFDVLKSQWMQPNQQVTHRPGFTFLYLGRLERDPVRDVR